jgi:hypothetical protein
LTFISTTVQIYVGDYRLYIWTVVEIKVKPIISHIYLDSRRNKGQTDNLPHISDSRRNKGQTDNLDCPGICGRLSVLPLFLRLSRYMWGIIGLTFISTTVQVYVGDYRFDLYFYDCPGVCGRLSV